MARKHATSGELIDIAPLGADLPDTSSSTLIRADHFEVFRMVLPAGKATPMHEASGLITIQCLEGCVELEAHDQTRLMQPGHLVYLADREPHAVLAIEDSSLLITMLLHRE
jgi:quercetin dioxygenase-like cupin family protein